MRVNNATSRVPFVVSLTLIFAYSILQAVVPPTTLGMQSSDTALASKPAAQHAIALIAQAETGPSDDAETRPLH